MRNTAALFSAAALFVTFEAAARSPVLEAEASYWQQVYASGLRIYQSSQKTGAAHSTFAVNCDLSHTPDPNWTGISLGLNGKMLPANSAVTLAVASQSFNFPTNKAGGISTDAARNADQFRTLWPLLRQGEIVEITAADGNSATLSLDGLAELLPAEPCETP